MEPVVHSDPCGHRPGQSAIDTIGTTRQRCRRYDWRLDIDVKAYFESIDRGLVLKAVHTQTDCPWILLYTEHSLNDPVRKEYDSVVPHKAGTPQGGVISPTLVDLSLHFAF